ncbi:hypothetical protein MITS9504_02147 [Synechococcus sp. MIT S9504]|nr:hypothetical protein MITS9504_02147 [Synechococcus sp. MIT S9504]
MLQEFRFGFILSVQSLSSVCHQHLLRAGLSVTPFLDNTLQARRIRCPTALNELMIEVIV